jgi:hypothetical protein
MTARSRHPFPYPAPDSFWAREAMKWYLERVLRIREVLTPDQEPPELAEQAWELKSRLRLAAAFAMREQELTPEFLRKMPLPSLDQLYEETGAFDPDDAARKVCDAILTVTEEEMCAFPTTVGGDMVELDRPAPAPAVDASGVPYGFPVATPDGFKPIEEIRAGDLVLSANPEGPVEPQPRRVLEVRVHERRTLRTMSTAPDEDSNSSMLAVTGDLQLWIEGTGWMRADLLDVRHRVRTLAGTARVSRQYPVFRTGEDGIGWIQNSNNHVESEGWRFDFARYEPLGRAENPYIPRQIVNDMQRYLRVPVYNLRVEEFNTFYVSGHLARGVVDLTTKSHPTAGSPGDP